VNKNSSLKKELHLRNRHRLGYNFEQLISAHPSLSTFVHQNKYQKETIDFSNPKAVKALNAALLKNHYAIKFWDIPEGYLCPPIPGRVDYIHYAADLLSEKNNEKIPKGNLINCWDVGTGANCIYPLLGNKEYGWSFIGSEIDKHSIKNCNNIITKNSFAKNTIEIRHQSNPNQIFKNIKKENEYFDLTICNPPFHASKEEAEKGSLRKWKNLNQKNPTQKTLNFGGKNNELWCEGGEVQFIKNMIEESKFIRTSCFWFTTLISKQTHLKIINSFLKKSEATEIEIIKMGQGNKTSQIIAWTFLSPKQQKIWSKTRW